jgi:hypothetical protein
MKGDLERRNPKVPSARNLTGRHGLGWQIVQPRINGQPILTGAFPAFNKSN